MMMFTVIGKLVRDPETRSYGSGTVTNLTVAANGYDRTKTTYIQAAAWNKAGDTISRYAKKGDKITLIGEPSTETYIDRKSGETRAVLKLNVEKFEFESKSPASVKSESVPAAQVIAQSGYQSSYDSVYIPEDPLELEEDEFELPF